ncbi:hypothetical protein ACNKHU_25720 [Shigella flexneri]
MYANVLEKGATEREELGIKITILILGVITISSACVDQNIAFMVAGVCHRGEL